MAIVLDPNKAKTARRVIEVLEYFDEQKRHATVMDIARRYKRPQSSTSELLAILVEMGLLYKDPNSRSYTPTPRAAMLGSLSQPGLVRDGRLLMLTERLVAQTGLGTALMGIVGLNTQIFRWMGGSKANANDGCSDLSGGQQERLCESAAGWLLLSTIAAERREGMMRRLAAEAPPDRRFSHSALSERVRDCARQGYAVGPAGFGTTADMCAVLLPGEPGDRPIAVGFVYERYAETDPATLIELLEKAVHACVNQPSSYVGLLSSETSFIKPVSSAA